MRKIILILLIIFSSLSITGCYEDMEKNSLEEYIAFIKKNKFGFSNTGIDHPKYFLPSISFFEDYNYVEGGYHWHDDDSMRGIFTTDVRPEIVILYLKYDATVYLNAKQAMLEKIEPYNNKFYQYKNYVFYENSNEINLSPGLRNFPEDFTMACYNDENYTLIFIGLESVTIRGPSSLDEKYLENIEDNWPLFIEQYYGKYYDFP